MDKKDIIILVILVVLLFGINYNILDSLFKGFFKERVEVVVERVIDGDTVVVKGNSLRLLGINAPEKGEAQYDRAKEYLEDLVLNKTVYYEEGREKRDKYGRLLAYLFIDGENINLKLIKRGFANIYFPSGKDKYYSEFKATWEECVEENKNLCKKSKHKCAECILLSEFDYMHDRVVFRNLCPFDCNITNWKIHDEGRKKFVFPDFELDSQEYVEIIVGEGKDDKDTLYWTKESYVWTRKGDTLFLRDKEGKLVFWKSY